MGTDFRDSHGYKITVLRSATPNVAANDTIKVNDDNVDVHVVFNDGSVYFATFFMPSSIQRLMKSWAATGECNSGQYFWSINSVIASSLSDKAIAEIVRDLIGSGEFKSAFGLVQQFAQQDAQPDTDKPGD